MEEFIRREYLKNKRILNVVRKLKTLELEMKKLQSDFFVRNINGLKKY